MKKIIALIVAGLCLMLVGVVSPLQAETKIGFVDIDKAANDSEEGKKAVASLKDYMTGKQSQINEKGKAIEKMKADLEKQGSVISAEARKSKIEEIERAERDFQRMLTDVNQELEKKRRELTESVYKEIIRVIEQIGQEGKYSVILPNQSLLYGDKTLDITNEVIQKYNEMKAANAAAPKKK